MNVLTNKWIFQDSISSPAEGNPFYTNRNNIVTVYITGSSTSRTILFQGADGEGNWYPIIGCKISDAFMPMATSTTGTNEKWQFDVADSLAIRMNVTAIAGGNLRITGRAVTT